jgi:hypothetical protein
VKIKLAVLLYMLILLILNGCSKQSSVQQSEPNPSDAAIKHFQTRAIGEASFGKLTIVPTSLEEINKLGAPSCLGLADDYSIKATYQVNFETKVGSKTISTLNNLEIINPNNTALTINKIIMGGMELFYFIPRYTDCHEQELYFYGVKDSNAFPITVELEEGKPTTLGIYPKEQPKLVDGDLVIKGGYAAGMEYISEYHFKLSTDNKILKLVKTIQLKPD